jgi:hypothetical protein
MDLQGIGTAATLALACAIVFVAAAKSWHLLLRTLAGTPNFADSILSESAERFRDELRSLSFRQSTYLGAGLVFTVMYTLASLFESPPIYAGYPDWQLYIVFTTLAAAAAFAAWRLAASFGRWRRVRLIHDANLAIGHQLHRAASAHGRAYHDVPTATGVVDHVLVGPAGIYAVSVLAERPSRGGTVRLDGNEVLFSNRPDQGISVVDLTAPATRLAKELTQLTGRNIRIRSVIATPGWNVEEQRSQQHLLVNERTLPMIRGWKDRSDYLLDEDVATIQDELTRRCVRRMARKR